MVVMVVRGNYEAYGIALIDADCTEVIECYSVTGFTVQTRINDYPIAIAHMGDYTFTLAWAE
jgi:hypothetical protein